MTLTDGRKRKLDQLRKFLRDRGYCPSYAELQKLWSLRSKNAVNDAVVALEREGALTRNTAGKIVGVRDPLPLLGSVRAGEPTDADEEVADLDTIDDYLVRRRDRTFLLKIDGDSMKDAGLLPGDIVVLERGAVPRQGDIVVARVDGGWTVKEMRRGAGGWELHPANPAYRPIRAKEEITIVGVVVGSFRRYRA